jgi:predicted secreted protein
LTWTSGIVVYVIIWWLVFFMSLPIGVRSPQEMGEVAEPGHEAGAPVRTHLPIKVLAATVIAALLWGAAYWMVVADVISIRNG